jgi:hypothetical protein
VEKSSLPELRRQPFSSGGKRCILKIRQIENLA